MQRRRTEENRGEYRRCRGEQHLRGELCPGLLQDDCSGHRARSEEAQQDTVTERALVELLCDGGDQGPKRAREKDDDSRSHQQRADARRVSNVADRRRTRSAERFSRQLAFADRTFPREDYEYHSQKRRKRVQEESNRKHRRPR